MAAPAQVRYPVDAYRLVYRTVSASGKPTRASGLLVLPENGSTRLRPLVFEHGTTVTRDVAPSSGTDSDALEVALLDGSAGFAAVAPDYLGLGVGPGSQAYLQTRTEVSASVDMVRAAARFAARRGVELEPEVLVSGFSQGGQAALALGKALGTGATKGLSLAGLTAVSGVYDLQGAEAKAILSGAMEPTASAFNLALLALSWNRLYHLDLGPSKIFRPGTEQIARLFDGSHPEPQIFAALPHTLTGLFRPTFLDRLEHPTGALLHALRANDQSCRWRSRVPVRLYFSPSDEVVAPLNTAHCVAQLRAEGGSASATSLGSLKHLQTIGAAAPLMLRWLERFRP